MLSVKKVAQRILVKTLIYHLFRVCWAGYLLKAMRYDSLAIKARLLEWKIANDNYIVKLFGQTSILIPLSFWYHSVCAKYKWSFEDRNSNKCWFKWSRQYLQFVIASLYVNHPRIKNSLGPSLRDALGKWAARNNARAIIALHIKMYNALLAAAYLTKGTVVRYGMLYISCCVIDGIQETVRT